MDKVAISRDVADFLALVLSRQSISAADPNFDETVAMVGRARRELMAALTSQGESESSVPGPVRVTSTNKGRAKANNTSRRGPEQH